MTCINVAEFVLISELETDHSMIETHRLKNVVIFIQTTLSFVLSRKIYFIYFRVIILGHNRVFEGKNLTILFVHFLRSYNKWECAFKKYCLFIFLIFLITEKIIPTSPLCFLIINFARTLYFKTFIKFKSNYQRSLKLPKQKESY